MKGIVANIILGILFILFGFAIVEVTILSDDDIVYNIVGILLGAIFYVPGASLILSSIKKLMAGGDKSVSEALKKDEADEKKDPFRELLISFREHYSDFFEYTGDRENEKIQWEATQLYRNILEFRKNRLKKLNITCETIVKSLQFKRPEGISKNELSDGKYDITEVEEEIAAKTIYKKDGKEIYSQAGNDLAYYTVVHTKNVGDDKIICPSCGVETTREELLDGCDYCNTKFMIEDLGDRVAEFAIRPDYEVAYAKYKKLRNKISIFVALLGLAVLVFMLTRYTLFSDPSILEDPETGIFFNSLIIIIVVCFLTGVSICVILMGLLMFPWIIPLISIIFGGINVISKSILKKLKVAPQMDKSFSELIKKYDPNFSISNFYSGLQNKISSVIYADTKSQLEAFSRCDLSKLAERYKNVIDIQTEYMGIVDYSVDDELQKIAVEVNMKLLEYNDKKCSFKSEVWQLELVKSAACKTQVVCAPAIMTCKSCGVSLDLLKGKKCSFCGNNLELESYDWVIDKIEVS